MGMALDARCENRPTQEDMLCDNCRERDCENIPPAIYVQQTSYRINSEYPLPWDSEIQERYRAKFGPVEAMGDPMENLKQAQGESPP